MIRRAGLLRLFGFAGVLVAILISASGFRQTRVHEKTSGTYLVMIVLDGFRPDYMNLAAMPNLHSLMQSGMSYPNSWVGQLETETPSGHATLATGVYPRKHGVIGFGWRGTDPSSFTWMPTDLRQLGAGNMERLIRSGGVPTLSDLLHRQNPAAKSVSLSGEKYYAADAMGAGSDFIVYGKRSLAPSGGRMYAASLGAHLPPPVTGYTGINTQVPPYPYVQDQFVGRLALRFMATVRPRMLLINLPGTDIQGHIGGGVVDPISMSRVVQSADDVIGTVVDAYRRAGLAARTIFVVTADHGMLPNRHIVPRKAMYAAIRATGAVALEDDLQSTGGYVYLRHPSEARRVALSIDAMRFAGVEGSLYKTHVNGRLEYLPTPRTASALGTQVVRAYRDLADTIASPAGPDVILPYAEDTMGLVEPGNTRWGTHGGLSWRVQHIPMVISGPGVRHGVSAFPAQLVDVAPTVERLLGWPVPGAVDGVVLADALNASTETDRTHQESKAAQRSLDVNVLQAHSISQGGIVASARHT